MAGLYGSDAVASKVAGREILGLNALIDAAWSEPLRGRINFPLMAVISHLGISVIATSMLPLGPKTLVYGSKDAGKTVYAHGLRGQRAHGAAVRQAAQPQAPSDWLEGRGHVVRPNRPGGAQRNRWGHLHAGHRENVPPRAPETRHQKVVTSTG